MAYCLGALLPILIPLLALPSHTGSTNFQPNHAHGVACKALCALQGTQHFVGSSDSQGHHPDFALRHF